MPNPSEAPAAKLPVKSAGGAQILPMPNAQDTKQVPAFIQAGLNNTLSKGGSTGQPNLDHGPDGPG